MKARIHCDRCNHGLVGNTDELEFCKRVVQMMIDHRGESENLAAHRTGYTVHFPKWLITSFEFHPPGG